MAYRGDQNWTPEDIENFKRGIPRQVKPAAPTAGAPTPTPTGTPTPTPTPAPPTPAPAPASPGLSDNEIRARQWFTPPPEDTSTWANVQRDVLRPGALWASQIPAGLTEDLGTIGRGVHWAAGKLGIPEGPDSSVWDDPDRIGRSMTPTSLTPLDENERIIAGSGRGFGEWMPLMAATRGRTASAITAGEGTLSGGLGAASWQSEPDPNASVYHSGMAALQPELAATGRGVSTLLGAIHLPFISGALHVLAYTNPPAFAMGAAKVAMGWQTGSTMGDLRQPPYGRLQAPVADWPVGSMFNPSQGGAHTTAGATPTATPMANEQVPGNLGDPMSPPMMAPTPYTTPSRSVPLMNFLTGSTGAAAAPTPPAAAPQPINPLLNWSTPTMDDPTSVPMLPDRRTPQGWVGGF